MSVNGDLMVIRNGRSTSQVSVYNYPEHLNPFYEDDNHKRLRFWQINKNPKDGQGRRNSFSLGGLKDMWAFKSFRLKKKSSSLGINKTSESPPPLRRNIYTNENGYSTYDPRMRYTTGATNGSLGVNNAFQRNVPYRSSLQDMRNTQTDHPINGIGFNRNDRYRSTIQPASTSGSSGSGGGTPTQSLTIPTSRRSSQVSVASTNPFDDEDDDDVVMSGIAASSTPVKHPARKKRRAPPPPIPVHQIIKEESSSAGSTPSHKPSNTQPNNSTANEEEIHNLTAEIESFVKSSNTDNVENHETRSSTTVETTTHSLKQNGTIPKSQNSPTRESSSRSISSNIDIVVTPDDEPLFIREDEDSVDLKKEDSSERVESNKVKEIGQVETIHIRTESPRSTPERRDSSGVSSFRSETKPHSAEEETVISTTKEVVQVNEVSVKESPEKPKPPIATKPIIPKSPPPVSPRLSTPRREMVIAETPDTPAMRRKEIRVVEEVSSSPEMPHREIGIDVGPPKTPTPSRHEVTIKIVSVGEDRKQERVPESSPIPAVREHKPTPPERNSSYIAAKKLEVTEKQTSASEETNQTPEPKEEDNKNEESNSNLEGDLPTTISELQLIISEIEEVADRMEESTTQANQSPQNLPKPVAALTQNNELTNPAPIQKPPRHKHFAEDINENIYRPRPSQWKESTLAPLEPVPPEKRRSVKQIIDSINRNQKLLGGAKKEEETEIDVNNPQRNQSETNTNAMEQNLKSLAESQREMKRMLLELESLENTHQHEQKLSNKADENFQGILDTIVSTLNKETDKNGNVEVFKKCTITKEVNNTSRESSPTSSNLDWNPLPKPKRTNKNLSPELQVKRNNKQD